MTNRNETAGQAKRRTIITAMRQGREYTSGDIERMTGIEHHSAAHQLGKLVKMGLAEQTGYKDSTRIYALAKVKVTA